MHFHLCRTCGEKVYCSEGSCFKTSVLCEECRLNRSFRIGYITALFAILITVLMLWGFINK